MESGRPCGRSPSCSAARLARSLCTPRRRSVRPNHRSPPSSCVSHVPTQADRDRLTNLGLDLTEHGGHGYVEVVLHSAADATALAGAGFTWTVTIPDLALREKREQRAQRRLRGRDRRSRRCRRAATRTARSRTTTSDLRALAAANPPSSGCSRSPARSLEGRDILGVEISENVPSTTDGKPVFLIMGLHHAREWPSGEHAIEFAIDLVRTTRAGNSRITDLLETERACSSSRSSNPDGFEQSRKWGDLVDIARGRQRRPGHDPRQRRATRTSARTAASSTASDRRRRAPARSRAPAATASASTSTATTAGSGAAPGASDLAPTRPTAAPAPFSEPETQTVRELISPAR